MSFPPKGATITEDHRRLFRNDLPEWFEDNQRTLPWREVDQHGRRDPYRVWLAEVMLQQTRVDQARPYFDRFVSRFPTLESLAGADLDDVLISWEGLGYYSRARNLHNAVREVAATHEGRVPDDPDLFRQLPGVGPYTTAAVQSLAFGAPMAVVDGNVIRVLSRVFCIEDNVKRAPVRREIAEIAQDLIDGSRPALWNEALMELGATVCTPRSPKCEECPLAPACNARATGRQADLPVAAKAKPVPHHDIAVAVIIDSRGRVLIQRRPDEAMLGGMWEFPGGKVRDGELPEAAAVREAAEELGVRIELGERISRIRHAYSHFKITLHAFRASLAEGIPSHHRGQPIAWVAPDELSQYAFPRANRRLIEHLTHDRLA